MKDEVKSHFLEDRRQGYGEEEKRHARPIHLGLGGGEKHERQSTTKTAAIVSKRKATKTEKNHRQSVISYNVGILIHSILKFCGLHDSGWFTNRRNFRTVGASNSLLSSNSIFSRDPSCICCSGEGEGDDDQTSPGNGRETPCCWCCFCWSLDTATSSQTTP